MKKIKTIAVLMLIFSLAGCSKTKITKIDPNTNLNCPAKIQIQNQTVTCNIKNNESLCEIEITDPQDLNGMHFKWLGDSYSVSFKGLECNTCVPYLPQHAFAPAIRNALKESNRPSSLIEKSSNENSITYTGDCDSGKFNLTTNQEGKILKISFDECEIEVIFLQN